MKARTILVLGLSILGTVTGIASPMEGSELTAITGATIVPVEGEKIPGGVILIKNGLIEDIGAGVNIPEDARIIQAEGLFAYPGLIDASCFLGLQEIGAVRATVDTSETGRINPQVRAVEAIRPDSMHIPISRANGITLALVAPSGGLVAGWSGLIRLEGWTAAEMTVEKHAALCVEFPGVSRRRRASASAESEQESRQLEELKELFHQARFYHKRRSAAEKNPALPLPDFDEKMNFLKPVIDGERPLLISVHRDQDILNVLKFVEDEHVKAILFGITDGWKVADQIRASGLPVIFGSMNAMPARWEDGYDIVFRQPGIFNEMGVKIAFSSQSSSSAKDLPWHAAKAAAFGLDREEALKAVTLYPAQILGLDDKYGSLEKGKVADIVLTDGDILEIRTRIKHVYINGKETDLKTVYEELLERYKKRD